MHSSMKASLIRVFCIFFIDCVVCLKNKNNVCRTIEDYAKPDDNDNCWHAEDLESTPEQIALDHGFQFKNYSVLTNDGYYLNLFRIRRDFNDSRGEPVLLHHGFLENALCFMSFERSTAFSFARKGYDVWLSNQRGNTFSSRHKNLTTSDPKFWDFSFHEIALYDIPATLEFINQNKVQREKIIFIGHSLGATVAYVYASLKKNHADRHLKGIISIAPFYSAKYFYSPVLAIFYLSEMIGKNFMQNGEYSLFGNPSAALNFCSKYPNVNICRDFVFIVDGAPSDLLPEYIPLIAKHFPSRSSIKILLHIVQTARTTNLQSYDYGLEENLIRHKPVLYNLSQITLPIHIFHGLNDALSTPEGVSALFDQLKTTEKSINVIPRNRKIHYNHLDFLYGKRIENFFHKPLFKIIKQLGNRI